MELLHVLEEYFSILVSYGILFLEFSGFVVLIITACNSLYKWITRSGSVQLQLSKGIALALEFKLGGEVLRTVIVREKSELFILGAIIVLRGALTFLTLWKIKGEESRLKTSDKVL